MKKIYLALHRSGFDPWMDKEKLPGQNWPKAIERAIELTDFFVGCFSRRSVGKRGHFQSELAYALDVSTRVPQEQIFFVPVRLDNCEFPRLITDTTHYVTCFQLESGNKQVVKSLKSEHRQRRLKASEPFWRRVSATPEDKPRSSFENRGLCAHCCEPT